MTVDFLDDIETPAAVVNSGAEVAVDDTPIPGMIILENTTKSKIGITLRNGAHLSLYPCTKDSTKHRSKPFPGNLFPDTQSNQIMLQKGIIKKIKF